MAKLVECRCEIFMIKELSKTVVLVPRFRSKECPPPLLEIRILLTELSLICTYLVIVFAIVWFLFARIFLR